MVIDSWVMVLLKDTYLNIFTQAKKSYVIQPNTFFSLNLVLDNTVDNKAKQDIGMVVSRAGARGRLALGLLVPLVPGQYTAGGVAQPALLQSVTCDAGAASAR